MTCRLVAKNSQTEKKHTHTQRERESERERRADVYNDKDVLLKTLRYLAKNISRLCLVYTVLLHRYRITDV